ncbi:hypothetical protein OUZ56_021031 [Daphnia magna]|uniref:Uncharacterized protein n=1 Tax=Daphnia magna TaxID=35525 RepID=A0ABQ9ZG63_9CRUS|nr:hypothetical protein OUZ56_021031 [Daphnia magna]
MTAALVFALQIFAQFWNDIRINRILRGSLMAGGKEQKKNSAKLGKTGMSEQLGRYLITSGDSLLIKKKKKLRATRERKGNPSSSGAKATKSTR